MRKTLDFIRLYIIIILGIILFLRCGEDQKAEKDLIKDLPDQVIENATMVFTVNGKKSTVIKAKSVFKWVDKDFTKAKTLEVDFYDTLGEHTSHLTADSGWVWERRQKLEVLGNVFVVTDDGVKLETESLKWDPKINKITTDDFVKITKGKDIMSGYGLEADQNLRNFKIKKEVKGEIVEGKELRD